MLDFLKLIVKKKIHPLSLNSLTLKISHIPGELIGLDEGNEKLIPEKFESDQEIAIVSHRMRN